MGEHSRIFTSGLQKVILFGSTGMVGSDFQGDILRPKIDATKYGEVAWYLHSEKPKYVINAIGMPRFCDDNPIKCTDLNILVPVNLALACRDVGAKLIHFSTTLAGDYNLYARSKAYADYFVSTFCPDFAIIKIGWMFGLKNDRGFVKTVKDAIKNKETLKVYDEVGVASYTVDVAEFIMENLGSLKGTVLVANKGKCTKKEFARQIIDHYKSDVKIDYTKRKEAYKKDSYEEGQLRYWREALGACLCDKGSLHLS
jgi:dTDP-4-dehydrorhamnose reductase